MYAVQYVSFVVIYRSLLITTFFISFLSFPFTLLSCLPAISIPRLVIKILQRLISINIPLVLHILDPLFRQEKVPGRCSRKSYYC